MIASTYIKGDWTSTDTTIQTKDTFYDVIYTVSYYDGDDDLVYTIIKKEEAKSARSGWGYRDKKYGYRFLPCVTSKYIRSSLPQKIREKLNRVEA